MFPKVAQIVETALLTYNDPFLSSPKSQEYFWATFVTKCVTINFQKSPNPVTLVANKKNDKSSEVPNINFDIERIYLIYKSRVW